MHAGSFVYFNDHVVGTDRMAEALASLSGTNTVTTVTSSADFAAALSGGGYDLGILMIQNSGPSSYADGINALSAFVNAGGKAIYTDWTHDNGFASAFGVQWTGNVNQGQVTVTDAGLSAGISGGVLNLVNPGWGVFSMGLQDATVAHFESGEGAIAFGNDGRTIVNGFLTDTFVDGVGGKQLYVNEIEAVMGEHVPDSASCLLLVCLGMTGLLALRRRLA